MCQLFNPIGFHHSLAMAWTSELGPRTPVILTSRLLIIRPYFRFNFLSNLEWYCLFVIKLWGHPDTPPIFLEMAPLIGLQDAKWAHPWAFTWGTVTWGAPEFPHLFSYQSQSRLHTSKVWLSRAGSGDFMPKWRQGNAGSMVTYRENQQKTLLLLPKELIHILLSRNPQIIFLKDILP